MIKMLSVSVLAVTALLAGLAAPALVQDSHGTTAVQATGSRVAHEQSLAAYVGRERSLRGLAAASKAL